MRTFEVICIAIGLIPLPVTVVAALLGDESAPVNAGCLGGASHYPATQ